MYLPVWRPLVPQGNGKTEVTPELALRVLEHVSMFPVQIKSTGKRYCE
jgi:hypothetical protein